MSDDQMRPNLLTVIPGNITIDNFVPGRVYKETLMIYNTCNVPIVINLKSSDKSKLSISETKLRIGVNQAKKLDLLIQDKINYKYIKTPTKQKKLFIHMKGDLIDVKYEINLLYYDKNKNNNSQRNNFNQNFIDNNIPNQIGNEIQNQMLVNNQYSDFPQGYLTENPNNFINKQNNNNPNLENYNNQYPPNYYNENINNNLNIDNDNYNEKEILSYMPIKKNDNEEIMSLKNIINELTEKVVYLQSLLDQNQSNTKKRIKNKNKQILKISHDSFYIFGSGLEKEIKNKYKLDDGVEIQRILSKNKILELENSSLSYRIKCLEKKLSLYTNDINMKNEEDENDNDEDIIDVDINLENNNEEENYLNNNNDYIKNNILNVNKDRYKYIYGERMQEKYLNYDNNNYNYIGNQKNNILPKYKERRNKPMNYNINYKDNINLDNYQIDKDDSF